MKRIIFCTLAFFALTIVLSFTTSEQRNQFIWNRVMADGTPSTLAGWDSGGDPVEVTAAETKSLVVSGSGGGTTNFLRADGTWAEPPSGSGGVAGLTQNRIPIAASATTLTDDAELAWNSTNNALQISGQSLFSINTSSFFFGGGNFTMTGAGNIGVGNGPGNDLTDGIQNTLIGHNAGANVTTGDLNTAIGSWALNTNIVGIENVAIGSNALRATTGSNNIGIGVGAGESLTSGSYNLAIGDDAEVPSPTASDQLSIQNAIYGAGNRAVLSAISNGNIGFYTTSWGTNAQRVISVGNGVPPTTAIADGIQIYAEDTGDNTSTLGIFTEQAIEAVGTFTASHKIKVVINGAEYWLQLDAVTP